MDQTGEKCICDVDAGQCGKPTDLLSFVTKKSLVMLLWEHCSVEHEQEQVIELDTYGQKLVNNIKPNHQIFKTDASEGRLLNEDYCGLSQTSRAEETKTVHDGDGLILVRVLAGIVILEGDSSLTHDVEINANTATNVCVLFVAGQ